MMACKNKITIFMFIFIQDIRRKSYSRVGKSYLIIMVVISELFDYYTYYFEYSTNILYGIKIMLIDNGSQLEPNFYYT